MIARMLDGKLGMNVKLHSGVWDPCVFGSAWLEEMAFAHPFERTDAKLG